jgi:uncharacterized damage-inducible protein DinB
MVENKLLKMKSISKPTEIADFYQPYLHLVPNDGQLIKHLNDIITETKALISTLTEEQLRYRYAEGKWTIKDILLHLSDCERVIIYRAMRFARADTTELPAFDENLFVDNAGANTRTTESLLAELEAFRNASIVFITSLDDAALDRKSTANNYKTSVRLLVNHLYGHHQHHLNIIRERYI